MISSKAAATWPVDGDFAPRVQVGQATDHLRLFRRVLGIKASRKSSGRPIVHTRDEVKDENRVLDAAETMLIGPRSRQISAVGWQGGASAVCAMSMTWSKDGPTRPSGTSNASAK